MMTGECGIRFRDGGERTTCSSQAGVVFLFNWQVTCCKRGLNSANGTSSGALVLALDSGVWALNCLQTMDSGHSEVVLPIGREAGRVSLGSRPSGRGRRAILFRTRGARAARR